VIEITLVKELGLAFATMKNAANCDT